MSHHGSLEPATVELDGLGRRFGERGSERWAVESLSLRVEAGELFGLVGPDGAGKTTTLRMLSGVLAPSRGDARVAGVSVAREPARVQRDLAYMSQRFGLYADLTVAENLDFYADLYRVPRAERAGRLERLYGFSGLGPFAGRLAGALSGGMKQKLGLSCALVHEPRLLLLDEPTFGVDPVSRRELWKIVHERVGRGTTAIVSTAYLDEAERFDRLALLDQGRLLAVGSPAELVGAYEGTLFEVRTERAREARHLVSRVDGVRHAQVFGEKLHATASSPAVRDALVAALAAGGIAAEVERVAPTLEDVFLASVAHAESGPRAAAEATA